MTDIERSFEALSRAMRRSAITPSAPHPVSIARLVERIEATRSQAPVSAGRTNSQATYAPVGELRQDRPGGRAY